MISKYGRTFGFNFHVSKYLRQEGIELQVIRRVLYAVRVLSQEKPVSDGFLHSMVSTKYYFSSWVTFIFLDRSGIRFSV